MLYRNWGYGVWYKPTLERSRKKLLQDALKGIRNRFILCR